MMDGIILFWLLGVAMAAGGLFAWWRWSTYEPEPITLFRHAGWGFTAVALAVLAVVMLGIAGVYTADRAGCGQQARDYGRPYHYGVMAGCRIQTTEGVYIPFDRYTVFHEEQRNPG